MAIRRIQQSVSNCLISSSSVFSPVSVVKELLDNAIDAKCTQIQIEVDSDTGGLKHVLCKDNGTGVVKRDRALMCCNCTTSKISDIGDVNTVETLGFRGEALFFVSQMCETMEVSTRTKDDVLGEKWIVKSGVPSGFKPVAAPVGTAVALTGLFKATPVRRNLLKREHRSTIDKLKSCILSYTLAFPEIRFVLKFVTVSTAGRITTSPEQGLVLLARNKKHLLKQLYKLKYSSEKFFNGDIVFGDIRVAFILPRMRAQDDALKSSFKALSLNQRPLSPSLSLGRALGKVLNKIHGQNSLLKPNVWVLEIFCPLELVDVNIEPEKNDVLLAGLDEMLVEFGTMMEVKVKLENGIDDSAQAQEREMSAEELQEMPMKELDDDVSEEENEEPEKEEEEEEEEEEEKEAEDTEKEEVAKETDDVPLEDIQEPDEEPVGFPNKAPTKEIVPVQNDWTFTMLDGEDSEPEREFSFVETATPREISLPTSYFTTVPPSSQIVSSKQAQLCTPNTSASKLQLKTVSLPRASSRKCNRLEDMTEPYGEILADVEVTNIRYASEREVQWLYRKGRPSVNLLDGYLRLSQLTSAKPLASTDEITIEDRKKWMKLC